MILVLSTLDICTICNPPVLTDACLRARDLKSVIYFCWIVMQRLNSATSAAPVKKGSLPSARNVSANRGSAVKSASTKPAPVTSRHESSVQKESVPPRRKVPTVVPIAVPAVIPFSSFVSPGHSGDSISTDETMSSCDSMKSPDFEYIDNGDSSLLDSLQRRANENLRISDDRTVEGLFSFLNIDSYAPRTCALIVYSLDLL